MDEKLMIAAGATLVAAITALFAWLMRAKAAHLTDVVSEKNVQLEQKEAERARQERQYEAQLASIRAERDKLLASLEQIMEAGSEPPQPRRTVPERVERAERFVKHVTKEISLSPEDIKRLLQKMKRDEEAS